MHLPSLGLPPRCWTSSSQVLRQRFPPILFTLVHHSTYILTPTSLLHQISLCPTNKRLRGGITSHAAVVSLPCRSPLPHCIPPFSSILFVWFSHFLVRTRTNYFSSFHAAQLPFHASSARLLLSHYHYYSRSSDTAVVIAASLVFAHCRHCHNHPTYSISCALSLDRRPAPSIIMSSTATQQNSVTGYVSGFLGIVRVGRSLLGDGDGDDE